MLSAPLLTHDRDFSPEACPLYKAFLAIVTYDFDPGLVSLWNLNKDYTVVSLATDAVNVCLQQSAAGPPNPAASAAIAGTQAILIQLEKHPVAQSANVAKNIERSFSAIRRMAF